MNVKTCFFTFSKGHRVRHFVNGLLKKIFGPKSDEVIGASRKVNDDDDHDLLLSGIFRMRKQGGCNRWHV
jgi:hypothetical protein